MEKTVQGLYRDGKIELLEPAPAGEARVLVTFLSNPSIVDLGDRGIDEQAALNLRARLRSIASDWERPEMDVYDEVE